MRFLQIIGTALILIASPAAAKDAAAWIVAQKSGDVRVLRNGVQPASVQLRSTLAPGDLVATGPSGRAMLTNGDDYVIVAPSSRLVLPKEQQQSGFTRLVQQVGTMLYKVKHTGVPHFSVQTPMLAAVVKGTSFTIVVDQDRAAVQVTDGIVEVSSANGYAKRLVERGATVYVGRERPNEIVELKSGTELPAPTSTSDGGVRIESSGDVPLSAISDLTGGLLHVVPAAPVAAVVNTPVTDVVAVQPVTQAAETVAGTPVVQTADVTTPGVSTPSVTTPAVTTPVATVGAVTVPGLTVDPVLVTPAVITTTTVTTPAVTTPAVTTTPISTPAVTTPIVTVTPATVSPVTVPAVTVPTVTVTPTTVTTSPISTPTVTTPTVTTPAITTPIVTVPAVTVPAVTIPAVTVPPVTLPLGLGGLLGGGNSGPGGGGGGGGPGPH